MQSKSNIPLVGNSAKDPLNVGIGLYSSLMGTFTFPPPEVNMISHVRNEPLVMEVPFKICYLSNPWNLPNPNDETLTSMAMPLSKTKVVYNEIVEQTTKPQSQPLQHEESD
jgi:hypothetical protein